MTLSCYLALGQKYLKDYAFAELIQNYESTLFDMPSGNADPTPEECVRSEGASLCVVDTGPSQDIQMCVPDANACLAKRPAGTSTPYPRPHTETAVDLCTGGYLSVCYRGCTMKSDSRYWGCTGRTR